MRFLFRRLETNIRIIVLYKALNILVNVKLLVNLINQFVVFRFFKIIINNTIISKLNYAKTKTIRIKNILFFRKYKKLKRFLYLTKEILL